MRCDEAAYGSRPSTTATVMVLAGEPNLRDVIDSKNQAGPMSGAL
jgi:hypothetical protein